jgi:NAD(P)-dependent dehydrogenase (short-subunit alcohol dehydrogenase family)
MTSHTRPLAIVTGASSGIGYELAKCCAEQGFDLLIAADQPSIHEAAQEFRALGAAVYTPGDWRPMGSGASHGPPKHYRRHAHRERPPASAREAPT